MSNFDPVTYVLAKKTASNVADEAKTAAIEWLEENISEGGSVVDKSLSVDGAAADAKATGDAISDKAKIYKLYFDGSDIFRSESDWEEYIPMTFDEIYELCYDEKNFVYIGDGQMKYYPQLDLHVGTKPHSIEFISSAQLDGKNLHTRIIITEDNLVKTNQIIDTPYFEFKESESSLSESIQNLKTRMDDIGLYVDNEGYICQRLEVE